MSQREHVPPLPTTTDLSLVGAEHVRVYRETNGEKGYLWNGVPTLLLTTTGRRSGAPRTIPLIYTPVDDNYVIVASKGGSPTHPGWFLNLLANSRVQVQVKGDCFEALAHVSEAPERARLWNEAAKTWPNYEVYRARTNREIPVVVLRRLG